MLVDEIDVVDELKIDINTSKCNYGKQEYYEWVENMSPAENNSQWLPPIVYWVCWLAHKWMVNI